MLFMLYAERVCDTALTTIIPRYFFGLWIFLNNHGADVQKLSKALFLCAVDSLCMQWLSILSRLYSTLSNSGSVDVSGKT